VSDLSKQIVLFTGALLLRIPFLFEGYGVEEDSWGHVLNAAQMADTGIYEISRLPGHPLYEALLLILWNIHSPLIYNLPSAVAGAGATAVFYRLCTAYKFPMAFWWSVVFSFIPVVFISSTYTIDYSITLFFMLLSFEAALNNNPERAGIWLAVATGFRITALGMLVPIAYLILRDRAHDVSIALRLRKVVKLIFVAMSLSIVFYIPPISTYGWQFFDFHRPPYPLWPEVLYKMSIGIWGVTGTIGVMLFAAFFMLKWKSFTWQARHTVWLLVALVYALAYFRMPEKAAFWLPVVPFVLFAMAEVSTRRQRIILGSMLILSPLIMGINKSDIYTGSSHSSWAFTFTSSNGELFLDPLNGAVLNDFTKRRNKLATCKKIQQKLMTEQQRTLLISGWWYAMLEVHRLEGKWSNPNAILLYYARPKVLKNYASHGYQLRYLPEQAAVNDRKYNSSFTVNNATLMPIE
jgi:hypothetical protein